MIEAILHGIILAFGLIIPLGVQNVFVFNQGALQPNFSRALPVVITAGICDTILIVAAVSGVSILVLTFAWLGEYYFQCWDCFPPLHGVCFMADDCFHN